MGTVFAVVGQIGAIAQAQQAHPVSQVVGSIPSSIIQTKEIPQSG